MVARTHIPIFCQPRTPSAGNGSQFHLCWQRCTDRKSFFDCHGCNTLLHQVIPDNGALLRLDNDRFGGTNADGLRKRLRPGENSYALAATSARFMSWPPVFLTTARAN